MSSPGEEKPTRIQPSRNRGGAWVQIGGEEYRIPPLSLRAVIDLQNDVETLQSISKSRPTSEQMDIVVRIVHSALARNYPDMLAKDVDDMIDLSNYGEVLNQVLSIAGFKKATVGETPGEAWAAPSGTPSTSPSPESSDGLGSTSTTS